MCENLPVLINEVDYVKSDVDGDDDNGGQCHCYYFVALINVEPGKENSVNRKLFKEKLKKTITSSSELCANDRFRLSNKVELQHRLGEASVSVPPLPLPFLYSTSGTGDAANGPLITSNSSSELC